MDAISFWQFKALRLSVGLLVLVLWGAVFSLFQPMAMTSGTIFDPATVAYDIDYTNMKICGAFVLLAGMFFVSITFSTAIKSAAIEPARAQHYSPRFFRFVGFLATAFGVISIIYSIVQPF